MSTADIVTVLYDLVDKLKAYGYRYFNEYFFVNLRKEMVDVVKEAKTDHDLDRIPSTRRYETSRGKSSGRSFHRIQLWIGRRMLVSMPNVFGSGGSQGGTDILIMHWQSACVS